MATITDSGTARASSVLAAAGAYDASPISIPCDNFTEASFLIAYTRGGAAGAVTYKIEFSNDNLNWYQEGHVDDGPFAAGSDVTDLEQRVQISYTATGATIEKFMSHTIEISARWIRIRFKESGNVGAPGTVFCEFFLKGAN